MAFAQTGTQKGTEMGPACVNVCLYACGPLARLSVFALHVWHSNYLSALALARLLFLYRLTLWR